MNRPIRSNALALLALFAVLAVAVTYQQAIAGPGYHDDLRNRRTVDDIAGRERGPIITADGEVVARSVEEGPDRFIREYPWANSYAHVVGYSSPLFGTTGIEASEDDRLRAADTTGISGLLEAVLGRNRGPDEVHLTIHHDLQLAAEAALDEQRGAIVVLDPTTGAILAMVSAPSFDPNGLLDPFTTATGNALAGDPAIPLKDRATEEVYSPGSTFKIVTAAAALENGVARPDTQLPDTDQLLLPGTSTPIGNADGGFCGNGESITLAQAMVVSCNTAFATLGTMVGAPALVATAEAIGFNDAPPFPWPVAESRMPTVSDLADDVPALAMDAIGERDVRATPLQMALVAAAVANEGVMMRPYLVQEVVSSDGALVESADPTPWRTAFGPETATALLSMMEDVVISGTATAAAVPGLVVAGKTGTAEVPSSDSTVWFVGMATVNGDADGPAIAIAVVFEAGGGLGSEGSGGRVAAPAAALVMEAWLASLG